ncbi:MAG: 5'-3'-deoxyribonucleotidase [Anaerolineae bacterium]|nr:5'-3'-deoxyribonucleotidase [Anaerolineae bacterium]
MRILVDMDGVIADFEGGFLQRWRDQHPDKSYIPIADRRGFYIQAQYPEDYAPDVRAIFQAPGFFRDLPPIPGGLDALRELDALDHEVFICSSPLAHYHNCVLEKYLWVDDQLGPAWIERVVLTRDKTLIHADILIDDRLQIVGREAPTWEHIVYDQPYNRADTGDLKRRLTWETWRAVLLGE